MTTTLTPPATRFSPRQVEILDTLQALFLAEGFRHLTIGDLVDRLRCSRRTLYGQFDRNDRVWVTTTWKF